MTDSYDEPEESARKQKLLLFISPMMGAMPPLDLDFSSTGLPDVFPVREAFNATALFYQQNRIAFQAIIQNKSLPPVADGLTAAILLQESGITSPHMLAASLLWEYSPQRWELPSEYKKDFEFLYELGGTRPLPKNSLQHGTKDAVDYVGVNAYTLANSVLMRHLSIMPFEFDLPLSVAFSKTQQKTQLSPKVLQVYVANIIAQLELGAAVSIAQEGFFPISRILFRKLSEDAENIINMLDHNILSNRFKKALEKTAAAIKKVDEAAKKETGKEHSKNCAPMSLDPLVFFPTAMPPDKEAQEIMSNRSRDISEALKDQKPINLLRPNLG